jgi:hypothetical protein
MMNRLVARSLLRLRRKVWEDCRLGVLAVVARSPDRCSLEVSDLRRPRRHSQSCRRFHVDFHNREVDYL